jgi:RimJ/RimL family protein N-acetyltransferase
MIGKTLKGKNIYLKSLDPNGDLSNYFRGINDKELTKYLEAGKKQHTIKDLQDYINRTNASEDHILFGIFLNETHEHIGNVTLDNIDVSNRKAEIGIFLWSHQGKGYATEAVKLLARYAFTSLNLNKLYSGAAVQNHASVALFKRCGFEKEGILKMDFLKDNKYYDVIRFGLLKSKFLAKM